VDQIADLAQASSSGSSKISSSNSKSKEGEGTSSIGSEASASTINTTRIWAVCAQATAVLEQSGPGNGFSMILNLALIPIHLQDVAQRVQEFIAEIHKCPNLSQALLTSSSSEDDMSRSVDKVDRALERLRRATCNFLETSPKPTEELCAIAGEALRAIIKVYTHVCLSKV
jgi:hypothetical protein